MPKLNMTLLENSISFFMESLAKAVQAEQDEDKWKFAILFLVQAIETSLKERLRRSHELFIYTDIDKPKHTVALGLVLERLERISKINLKQRDLACIRTASSLRNQIVHFEFDLSTEQIKSNLVSLVGFYIAFCRDHLEAEIVSNLPPKLHTELLSLDSYVEELESRAADRIATEGIHEDEIWECPACKKVTFVIYDGKDTCYLCGHHEPLSECETCNSLQLEQDMEQVDFGNMKRIENYKSICRKCFYRIETEDPYEHYY